MEEVQNPFIDEGGAGSFEKNKVLKLIFFYLHETQFWGILDLIKTPNQNEFDFLFHKKI